MQAPNFHRVTDDIFFKPNNLCLILVNEDPFCCVPSRADALAMIRTLGKALLEEKKADPRYAAGTLELEIEDTFVTSEPLPSGRLLINKQSISRFSRAMNGFKRIEFTLRFIDVPDGVLRTPTAQAC